MREWIAVTDIARAMGCTERSVRRTAARERWHYRLARSKGRPSYEYHIASIPEIARIALVRASESASALPAAVTEERAHPSRAALAAPVSPRHGAEIAAGSLFSLTPAARRRAEVRARILAAFAAYRRASGLAIDAAARQFTAAFNSGALDISPASAREAGAIARTALSVPTLLRWRREAQRGGIARLGGHYGRHRRGTGLIDRNPEIGDTIIAIIAHHPHASLRRIHRDLVARFGADAPSLYQVSAFATRWRRENASTLLAISNPDAWRSRRRLALADAGAGVTRLHQEWQIDGTPGDVELVGGRHHVMVVVDVYSRRMMALVTKTARADAAARLVRRAILAWGVPETIRGDNGKEFVAHHMQRVLHDLGIEYAASEPFRPEQKPFVERAIGTMMHDLFEQLPGFIGHSVADRKAIESRRAFAARLGEPRERIYRVSLTAADLQARIDDWCEHVYANRAHRGLAGRTPNEVATAYRGAVAKVGSERALDLLLGSGEVRMVGKEGIRVSGARYFCKELVPYVGERVLAIADEDMGRLYVYSMREPREFVGVAISLDRLGASRTEMAMLAKAAQTRLMSDARRAIRRLKSRIRPEIIVDEKLAIARAAAAAAPLHEAAGDAVIHETAALLAAEVAAQAESGSGALPPAPHDPEILERGGRALRTARVDERDEQLAEWDRYERLMQAAEAGQPIAEYDREWMRAYERTPFCQSQLKLGRWCIAQAG